MPCSARRSTRIGKREAPENGNDTVPTQFGNALSGISFDRSGLAHQVAGLPGKAQVEEPIRTRLSATVFQSRPHAFRGLFSALPAGPRRGPRQASGDQPSSLPGSGSTRSPGSGWISPAVGVRSGDTGEFPISVSGM